MRPKASSAPCDHALRLARLRQVGRDMEVAGALGAPTRADDARALCLKQSHDLEPDPFGRAGDDAYLVLEAQIHRRLR